MAIRRRFWVLAAAAVLAAVAVQAWPHGYKTAPPGYLIAHAGGGLPFSRYTNSREAFDASYRRGLRLFESDLQVRHGGDVVLGHDLLPRWPAPMSFAELLGWLRAHPDAVLVTDFKGANIAGLAAIPADLRGQVIPQIYRPAELAPVRALGYRRIIYTAYAAQLRDAPLLAFVNHADLYAVTLPLSRAALAPKVRHPVLLHTLNDPAEARRLRAAGAAGFYTDYLTPA